METLDILKIKIALTEAYRLLDSVAYVSAQGDTEKPLAFIERALRIINEEEKNKV